MSVSRAALVGSSDYFARMLGGPFAERNMVWNTARLLRTHGNDLTAMVRCPSKQE
jgi:hypothetical protein